MGICICFHIFKLVLPWNVVREKKTACEQHLAEHNKRSIPLFTTTSVLMHVFHYIRANLPFVVLGMIYMNQSAVKTPQSHCSYSAFLFLLFIPPYFKAG